MKIILEPDYCCGGGHCGPMPGYYYFCPECNKNTSAAIGYPLEVGQFLTCRICKAKIKALEKIDEFIFEFEVNDQGTKQLRIW